MLIIIVSHVHRFVSTRIPGPQTQEQTGTIHLARPGKNEYRRNISEQSPQGT